MSLASRCLRPMPWQPRRTVLAQALARHPFPPSLQRRSYHGQEVIISILDSSQALILGLHNITGTPWYITIPLVALGVTATFRLPFTIYTQKLLGWRSRYTPIVQAWAPGIISGVVKDGVPPAEQQKVAQTRTLKEIKRLWKKTGLQEWKLYTGLVSLPIWLVAIDSIRRLCGGPRGLLGAFFLPNRDANTPTDAAAAPSLSPALDGAAPSDVVSATSSSAETVISTAEPSLMTEGALWFTDLTVADPYHILPFALSAVLVANMIPKNNARMRELFGLDPVRSAANTSSSSPSTGSQGTTSASQQGAVRRGLGRGMLIVSALVGPLTMDLPAAIHLYWLTSACASRATTRLIDRLYPLDSKMVKLCKGTELPIIRPRSAQTTGTMKTDTIN
ncbi:mitochondrial inner membrane protein COX18 [Microdochium nivale]|nr:mitochondrial inner membrane protein COX18 [Microdochium nivale]